MKVKKLKGKRKKKFDVKCLFRERLTRSTRKIIVKCAIECLKAGRTEEEDWKKCFIECLKDKITPPEIEGITSDDQGHIHAGGSYP